MVIVIAGPTASGKSKIALQLAKDINGVIINGDSRQIYKELRIGTSRPIESEFEKIAHHLYGHISVKEKYNIYKYQKEVKEILENLPEGKIPIIVGGTGLYIDSVIYNYTLQEEDTSPQREELANKSIKELQSLIDSTILKQLNESDIVNPVRLRRIIEKGKLGNLRGEEMDCLYFVVNVDKRRLERNITERVSQMFDDGLFEENTYLKDNDLFNSTVSKIIGYKEFAGYFDGTKTIEDVKSEIIKNTKKYAKRQKTWFKRNRDAVWADNYALILERSTKFIKTE